MDTMERAERNHDYSLGLIAGIQLAQHDMSLSDELVEAEANESYERTISIMVVERSQYILGFKDGYTGWIAGIV